MCRSWGAKGPSARLPFFALLIGGLALGAVFQGFPFNLPDLGAERLVLTPEQPDSGDSVTITATVVNHGRARVHRTFYVSFHVDGALIVSKPIRESLMPGETIETSARWTATEGEHTVRVRVDPFNRVHESDEGNNELPARLVVRDPQGIRSLTLAMFRHVGRSLHLSGETLQLEPKADIYELIADFRSALRKVREAYGRSARALSYIANGLPWPTPLLNASQIQIAKRVAGLYDSISEGFDEAIRALERWNIPVLLEAFKRVQQAMNELDGIALEGIALDGLRETAPLMAEALEKTEGLEAALENGEEVDLEEAAQSLAALLREMGDQWALVGERVIEKAEDRAARFTDGDGEPIERYHSGVSLVVRADGAAGLVMEIFRAEGERIMKERARGSRLEWDGRDGTGTPLSPGRYFYRLAVQGSRSRLELGEIIVSP